MKLLCLSIFLHVLLSFIKYLVLGNARVILTLTDFKEIDKDYIAKEAYFLRIIHMILIRIALLERFRVCITGK